jgi:hypothetical protein
MVGYWLERKLRYSSLKVLPGMIALGMIYDCYEQRLVCACAGGYIEQVGMRWIDNSD